MSDKNFPEIEDSDKEFEEKDLLVAITKKTKLVDGNVWVI